MTRIKNEETGLTYQLNFKHHYKLVVSKKGRINVSESVMTFPIESHPYATTAYLRVLDKDLKELSCWEGYAECSKEDNFSRKVGRALSFYRAIKPLLETLNLAKYYFPKLLSEKDLILVNKVHSKIEAVPDFTEFSTFLNR